MIVNRQTFVVKRGCQQELVAMMLAEDARVNLPVTVRLYTPNIAPWDKVVAEWEFEDLAAYEKF